MTFMLAPFNPDPHCEFCHGFGFVRCIGPDVDTEGRCDCTNWSVYAKLRRTKGLTMKQAMRVWDQMEKAGDVETVSTSLDTKGRKQPASNPKKAAQAAHRVVLDAEIAWAEEDDLIDVLANSTPEICSAAVESLISGRHQTKFEAARAAIASLYEALSRTAGR